MDNQLVWMIFAFGAIALVGVFFRMSKGFGPFNLRVVGIVLGDASGRCAPSDFDRTQGDSKEAVDSELRRLRNIMSQVPR